MEWQISEDDKKRIIDEAVGSWKKYCEALKSHNDNSFTRDEVKSLMGIVHDSCQKEIESLRAEVDRLTKEKSEAIEVLGELYFSVYGGNSASLQDCLNRSVKDDLFEQKIVSLLTRIK